MYTHVRVYIIVYTYVILGNMGGYRGSKLNAIGREEGDTSPKKGTYTFYNYTFLAGLHYSCVRTIDFVGPLVAIYLSKHYHYYHHNICEYS
jgi:hypothetical protein